MKDSELHKKTKKELEKLVFKEREKLGKLSFGLSQGKLRDTSQIKKVKKDIARILTLLKNHF